MSIEHQTDSAQCQFFIWLNHTETFPVKRRWWAAGKSFSSQVLHSTIVYRFGTLIKSPIDVQTSGKTPNATLVHFSLATSVGQSQSSQHTGTPLPPLHPRFKLMRKKPTWMVRYWNVLILTQQVIHIAKIKTFQYLNILVFQFLILERLISSLFVFAFLPFSKLSFHNLSKSIPILRLPPF